MAERMMVRASWEVIGDFTEAYGRLEAEMDRVAGKYEEVEREKRIGSTGNGNAVFLKTISSLVAGAVDMPGEKLVDKEMFLALVDKVVVGDGLRFILRDGAEWEA